MLCGNTDVPAPRAMAYPIDVEKELTGVKLDYTAYDTAYDIGAITLTTMGKYRRRARSPSATAQKHRGYAG